MYVERRGVVVEHVKALLNNMTKEERLEFVREIMAVYCNHCGSYKGTEDRPCPHPCTPGTNGSVGSASS